MENIENTEITANISFSSLGLSAQLLKAIGDQGYDQPTLVQREAIPVILGGKDALVGAHTGTGKTAGFTLPILHKLSAHRGPRTVRALILTPTRELAAQVGQSVKTYGKYLSLKCAIIYGGVAIYPQIKALKAGIDILVATPGRLLDHVRQGTVDLSNVEVFVLDEADRMLDMGFIPDIRKVITLMPKDRQSLLFSATFSKEIKVLADTFLTAPKLIEVSTPNTTAEHITQLIHPVDTKRKRALLSFLITSKDWKQVLVFTRTKHCANKLVDQLEEDGIRATAVHGNKSQGARTKALHDFKRGAVRVLVATDVAARGLDIDRLPYVVNYELPNVPEDYVHRIGRTGRAGNTGAAISLVSIDENKFLRGIERLLKIDIQKVTVPGYEPDPSIKAVPVMDRFSGGSHGPRRSFGGGSSGQYRDRRPEGGKRFDGAKRPDGAKRFAGRSSKPSNKSSAA